MRNRGRPSAAALAIVPPADLLDRGRPPAPRDLIAAQAAEWEAIVKRLPPDWFPRETHGLLADYCRHVVRSRKIAKLIEVLESKQSVNVEDYDKLARMADRETKAILGLAQKMRISQLSTYDKSKGKGKGKGAATTPWQQ